MTHTRIRPFNRRVTPDGVDADVAQAVAAHGTTVFLRAQPAQDIDSFETAPGGPAAQADRAMGNIRLLLEECGSEMPHLCRLAVYLTDPAHREPVWAAIGEHLVGVHPASTTVVVQALGRPEWLVEIEATAVIPHSGVPAELDPNLSVRAAEAGMEAPIPREPTRGPIRPAVSREDEGGEGGAGDDA